MRILILSPYLPVPSQGGGGITYYDYIGYLSREHDVTLLCLCQGEGPVPVEELKPFCRRIEVRKVGKVGAYSRCALALLRGSSLRLAYYNSAGFRKLVRDTIKHENPDVILASHERMGQYAEEYAQIGRVIDLHDVVSARHAMMAARPGNIIRRAIDSWEARKLAAYERRCLSIFDQVWLSTVSEADRLQEFDDNGRLRVASRGVDTREFAYGLENSGSNTMIFTGNMTYDPNVDGAVFFCEEVLPLIKPQLPQARLQIVGNYPHARVMALARGRSDVEITGRVPSVADYLRKARVFICALRIGTGTRMKVLEAMAVGLPVVSTSVGCAGLGARDGEHLLVADEPRDFAAAVTRLYQDEDLYMRLSRSGRGLVEQQYDADRAGALAARFLAEVGARPSGRG